LPVPIWQWARIATLVQRWFPVVAFSDGEAAKRSGLGILLRGLTAEVFGGSLLAREDDMEPDQTKRDDLSEQLVEARIDLRKKEKRLAELLEHKKKFEDRCRALEEALGKRIESASSEAGVFDLENRQAGQSDAKELASSTANAQKAADAIATVEKEIAGLKKSATEALDKLVAAYR